MKKLLVMVLVLVIALTAFAGCGTQGQENPTETPDKTNAPKEKLLMYTEGGFPPFEYYDDNSNIVGIDVDLANIIANELGMELVINDVAFDSICAAVAKDEKAVGIAGLSITPDRLKNVDFSTPYWNEGSQAIIYKEGTLTPEDGKVSKSVLEGKNVGVQTGSTSDIFVSELGNCTVKQYNNALTGMMAIGSGCDYVMVDDATAKQLCSGKDEFSYAEIAEAEAEKYAIAVKKGNSELLNKINTIIEKAIEDGTIQALKEKHSEAA